MSEEILLISIGVLTITFSFTMILKTFKEDRKTQGYTYYGVFSLIFIIGIFLGILQLLVKPTIVSIVWITLCGFMLIWCIFDGTMVLQGKPKLLQKIFKTKKRRKKMIKNLWDMQEKLRAIGIILVLFGLSCQIIGSVLANNWKIILIGCVLMIVAIPILLTSSEIGRRKRLKQKEE